MALRKICLNKNGLLNAFQITRGISASSGDHEKIAVIKSAPKVVDWNRAIEDAIKCVRYQKNDIPFEYLTQDKDVKWLDHMKKLEGSNHPISDTVK